MYDWCTHLKTGFFMHINPVIMIGKKELVMSYNKNTLAVTLFVISNTLKVLSIVMLYHLYTDQPTSPALAVTQSSRLGKTTEYHSDHFIYSLA